MISVLVLHERWPGATGLSAYHALLRAGVSAHSITEAEVVPLRWRSRGMRGLGRIVRPLAVREFNAQLVDVASQLKPGLFLAFKGQYVCAQTVRSLRAEGIRCVNVYPDVSFTVHGPYLEAALPQYDWVFTTKTFGIEDLQARLGMYRASVLHHAFDRDIHRPRTPTPSEEQRLGCDVSFIGTWSPAKEALLEQLVSFLPECQLRVFGSQWERVSHGSPLAKFCTGHPVTGVEYAIAVACSRVNLGLLSERRPGSSSGDQITSRTFHIPAAGGCLLHQRSQELLAVLPEGEACEAFDGASELAEKVAALLADPGYRRRIADSGMRRVRGAHSWDHRIRALVRKLETEGIVDGSASREWPAVSDPFGDTAQGRGLGS